MALIVVWKSCQWQCCSVSVKNTSCVNLHFTIQSEISDENWLSCQIFGKMESFYKDPSDLTDIDSQKLSNGGKIFDPFH